MPEWVKPNNVTGSGIIDSWPRNGEQIEKCRNARRSRMHRKRAHQKTSQKDVTGETLQNRQSKGLGVDCICLNQRSFKIRDRTVERKDPRGRAESARTANASGKERGRRESSTKAQTLRKERAKLTADAKSQANVENERTMNDESCRIWVLVIFPDETYNGETVLAMYR